MPAQSDTLTPQQFIGRWSGYMISDNSGYAAIPDSLKNHTTIAAVVAELNPVYEINGDGTLKMYGDFMQGDTVTGTWQLQGDTLLVFDNGQETMDRCAMRCLAPDRVELLYSESLAGERSPVTVYFLWEKLAEPIISREKLIGKWDACWIYDTTAYFATPDSLKNEQSISEMLYPFRPTMELRSDGMMITTSDWLEEAITAVWYLRNDSLITQETYKKEPLAYSIRYVGPGRFELVCRVAEGARGEPETRYFLWVRKP